MTPAPVDSGNGSLGALLAGAALLAAVAGGLFCFDLGRAPLFDPDEARHSEVAREMATGHGVARFFLPTLELEPYREKPAGYYWLVAGAFVLAGVDAGVARLPNALAALATVLLVYAWARPRVGDAGALGASLVLATSAGWLGLARYGTLDMTLSALAAVGVLAGLAWLERPAPRPAPLVPYVCAGLGTLVKGPIACALVGLPLGLAYLLCRPRPTWRELGLVRGLLVILALVAVLYVPMALLDASYLTAFVATNVKRFGARAPHAGPVYYYLVWLPVLCLPWTLLAVPAVRRATREPRGQMLLAWAIAVPAVLTFAHGKLATYALSAVVPVALVVGPALMTPADEDRGYFRVVGWLLVAVLVAGAVGALVAAQTYPIGIVGRMLLAGVALGWAVGLAVALRRDRTLAVPMLTFGAVASVFLVAVRVVLPAVAVLRSDYEIARVLAPHEPAPVISYAVRSPSLVFYRRAPVIHASQPEALRDLFNVDHPVFIVTTRRHFAEIDALFGARAVTWYATPRRRLYGNHPPPGE